jgi:hypothetical protein
MVKTVYQYNKSEEADITVFISRLNDIVKTLKETKHKGTALSQLKALIDIVQKTTTITT